MSAIVNPSPSVGKPPLEVAPGQPPAAPGGLRRGKWIVAALVLAGFVAFKVSQRPEPTPAAPVVAVKTAKATIGPLEVTRRVGGQTSSRSYANITAPMMRGPEGNRPLVLMTLAKSGSIAKKGDMVAQFDPGWLQDHTDDTTATVAQAESDVRKRVAEQGIEWENLEQTLRVNKAELDKAKIEMGAVELRTAIDQELLKLALEEADARYEQARKDRGFKETSQKAEIRILELTRERHARHLERDKVNLTKYTMRAPIDGLIVMQSLFRGGEMAQIQEGDQVGPGQPFMKIVTPGSMQVEAMINQTESGGFRVGQKAAVGLDAFPDLRFEGKIYSIGALAIGGTRQNYYIRNVPVRVSVVTTDPRMIPDLSASADVLLERTERAIIVPAQAVQTESGKSVVWVKQGETFVARAVQTGIRTQTQVAVVTGLNEGEEVALNYARP